MRIISEPYFTVVLKNGQTYTADGLQTVYHEGRYCLSFVSSGHLQVFPIGEVTGVEFYKAGRQHCNRCDAALSAWPCNESPREYGQ